MLLPSTFVNSARARHTLLLLQSSAAQSCLPILRDLISRREGHTLLFCFLYSPECLVVTNEDANARAMEVFDHTGNIPGYCENWIDPRDELLSAAKTGAKSLAPHGISHSCLYSSSGAAAYYNRLSGYLGLRHRICTSYL